MQVCRGAYICFRINAPIFCCSIFFEECLNPQIRISKMVNEHTVDYHPSPSELTSRIHPLIFLWTPRGFISPEYLLNFFSNLFTPQWLRKSFESIVLRSLENRFVSQKIKYVHFYSRLQAKLSPRFLSSPLQTEGNYPFSQNGGGLWS